MSPRITLKHTLAAALVASGLAASTAVAQPIDRPDRFESPASSPAFTTSSDTKRDLRFESPTSSLAGTVDPAPKQDLRSESALEAARQAALPEVPANQPTWPVNPEPLTSPKPATSVPATSGGGDDDIWLVLGIGLAASGLVAGSAAGVARRYRVRARRVTA